MECRDGIYFGNYQTIISEVLNSCAKDLFDFYAVVSCIDSSTDAANWKNWKAHLNRMEILLESSDTFVTVLPRQPRLFENSSEIFTGFDQVEFLATYPPSSFRPFDQVTSDITTFNTAVPNALKSHLNSFDIKLILADGCGLNAASLEEQFLDSIERLLNRR